MKRTILFIFFILIASYLSFGSNRFNQKENIQNILSHTILKNPKMQELLYILTAKKIAESGKKIEIEECLSQLLKNIETEKAFAVSYTERYSPAEIAQIRALVENKVYDKYTEDSDEIIKESIENIDHLLDKLISESHSFQNNKAPSQLIEITPLNFEKEIQNNELPVVLDFYAEWCTPCIAMNLLFEQLSEELEGKIQFVRIDTVAQKEIAEKFKIKDLPVVLFIKNGKIKEMHNGFADKETVRSKINEFLF